MRVSRRTLLGSCLAATAAASAGAARAAARTDLIVLTPEMFGAKGDGITNDTAAFAALADRVNLLGGGTVRLRPRTYIVGLQTRQLQEDRGYAFAPAKILHLRGCRHSVTIEGNGAKLRCAPGLRFGTFDARTGEPTKHGMPYFEARELATPYEYMLLVEECSGAVTISNLELDGNLPNMRIGGQYGDTGWQIAGSGIFLRNNRGDEQIRDVYSHHHPQDGLMIDGDDDPALADTLRRIDNLRSEYNGRQGCSIVGGRGYRFAHSKFNHTGKAVLYSAPGAGVDIEAEGAKRNADLEFTDCEFSNNSGCAMVADSGDSERALFTRCRFLGTTNWSAWPRKPLFRFQDCTFLGSVVNCYGDEDPVRAAQFVDCTFTDDPRLSPTGEVYLGGRKSYAIVDLSNSKNVRFSRCSFRCVGDGLLPWSWFAIYSDCEMEQKSGEQAYPKGKYFGANTMKGHVDLYGTIVVGSLTLNGKPLPVGQMGGEPW